MDKRLLAASPLLASILWGGMYVVSKWTFDTIPPLTLAFLRVSLGAGILFGIIKILNPKRNLSRGDWRGFTILAVWLTVGLTTQFAGTDLTNASQGALMTVLTPVFILILGVALLGESLNPAKIGGTALATIGTLMVLADQYDVITMAFGDALGIVLLLLSSIAFAGYTIFGVQLIRRYSAIEAVTYSTVISVPMFFVFVPIEFLYFDIPPSRVIMWVFRLEIIAMVLYLGVLSTAAAWYFWYKGMEFADASTVAVFFFAQPVVGSLLGVVFLDERLGTFFLIGSIVMSTGIYVVSIEGIDADEGI